MTGTAVEGLEELQGHRYSRLLCTNQVPGEQAVAIACWVIALIKEYTFHSVLSLRPLPVSEHHAGWL